MSYRYPLITVFVMSLVIHCLQLRAQETSEGFPFDHIVNAPLKDKDVLKAFDRLGLSLERFKYVIPVPHKLRISLDYYSRGTLDTSTKGGSLLMRLGENEIRMFLKHGDADVSISVQNDNASSSVGRFSIKGYSATVWNPFALAKLAINERVPIGVLAADPNIVTGIGKDESIENIRKYVTKFAFAVVVYAEVSKIDK